MVASITNNAALEEIQRWERLGVPTLPGPLCKKGPASSTGGRCPPRNAGNSREPRRWLVRRTYSFAPGLPPTLRGS